MSSTTLVWCVKCMPFQLSNCIWLSVTKDILMDGWHMTKNQPTLAQLASVIKSQPNLACLTKNQPSLT
jgi:hypothetical protein